MEVELTLSSELEDLSEEYGLSRESESATASVPDDQQGTLDDSLYLDTHSGTDTDFDWVYDSDDGEVALVRGFLESGCGCRMGKDSKPCTSSLTFHDVFDYRADCHELTSGELDMVILGQLNAHYEGNKSVASTSRSSNAVASYFYKNNQQCRKCFLFMHTISDKRFRNLVDHYTTAGVTPRTHGLSGKSPSNTTSFTRVTNMLSFVKILASSISLPLPGHLPNFRDERIQLLPTDMSKMEVYCKYCKAVEKEGSQPIGRSTFLTYGINNCPISLS